MGWLFLIAWILFIVALRFLHLRYLNRLREQSGLEKKEGLSWFWFLDRK